jgi:uncharacterized small protein (DUF1192 family)
MSENNNETKRFLACGYDAEMKPFAQGDYVRYEDYELMKSDVKGLSKELADAQESYHLVNERTAMLVKENARLKAECQARQAENSVLAVECDSLKAEVERLTSDLQMEKENEDRLVREWQRANNEVYGLKTQVAALIDDQTRLKAEVERLTKEDAKWHELCKKFADKVERLTEAGDAIVDYLFATPQTPTCYAYIMDWRNAKNGGQSSSEKAPSFIEDLGNGVERHDLKFRVPSSAKNEEA